MTHPSCLFFCLERKKIYILIKHAHGIRHAKQGHKSYKAKLLLYKIQRPQNNNILNKKMITNNLNNVKVKSTAGEAQKCNHKIGLSTCTKVKS